MNYNLIKDLINLVEEFEASLNGVDCVREADLNTFILWMFKCIDKNEEQGIYMEK